MVGYNPVIKILSSKLKKGNDFMEKDNDPMNHCILFRHVSRKRPSLEVRARRRSSPW